MSKTRDSIPCSRMRSSAGEMFSSFFPADPLSLLLEAAQEEAPSIFRVAVEAIRMPPFLIKFLRVGLNSKRDLFIMHPLFCFVLIPLTWSTIFDHPGKRITGKWGEICIFN